jgi:hypothetical protein
VCPGTLSCIAGACTCPTGQIACNNACINGTTDRNNCGRCGNVCPGTIPCAGGMCVCPTGQTNCNNACVNVQTDRTNCGACGTACPGMVPCTAGVCACPMGQTNCSNVCVDTQFSASNCGACGRACAAGQFCVRGTCGTMPALYHGWTSPIAGCTTTTYNAMAPTNQGGQYPYNLGDSLACRAWKLAATVCTTMPVAYFGNDNWNCPMAGGFTDPAFGTFCPVANQYSCSTCPAACNATCLYTPLSLRDCMGREANQR